MLTHNQHKFIQSLRLKKYRRLHHAFIVEGRKNTAELLASNYQTQAVYALQEWLEENSRLLQRKSTPFVEVTADELRKISDLTTPDQVLAIASVPESAVPAEIPRGQISIMLDGIRDPGNMGTIIRTADWFRIGQIFCSPDCVDMYNPKVIQATMGSFCRVKVYYDDLTELLKNVRSDLPVYGALLQAPSLTEAVIRKPGVILIGNESNGITPQLLPFVSHPLHIPSFAVPRQEDGAESLNASVANAIICYEICKQLYHVSP